MGASEQVSFAAAFRRLLIHEQASFSLAVPGPLVGGRVFLIFASVDEAIAEAARLLLQKVKKKPPAPVNDESPDLLLGSMPDAADELDVIVAEAMKRRREERWRAISAE